MEMKREPRAALERAVNLKGVMRLWPRVAESQSTRPSPAPVASATTWLTCHWRSQASSRWTRPVGPSQALKAIALELGKKSGRNEFDGVYGEFYRRFEIPGYRELLARRFEEAMGFLREWSVAVAERDGPPF